MPKYLVEAQVGVLSVSATYVADHDSDAVEEFVSDLEFWDVTLPNEYDLDVTEVL